MRKDLLSVRLVDPQDETEFVRDTLAVLHGINEPVILWIPDMRNDFVRVSVVVTDTVLILLGDRATVKLGEYEYNGEDVNIAVIIV